MMTEIITELTTIKETSDITRKQDLALGRTVEAQRAQKALIETT